MFDFLLSEEHKLRRSAAQWLEMAERVYDYRHDLLTPAQLESLQSARAELKKRTKDGSKAAALKDGIERLEKVLATCGGRIYPTNSLVENVDFFLVAAIVILGLRAYFIQPFKIPTNSMWPTYNGMTSEVYQPGEQPGAPAKAARFLLMGATNYTLRAPADGEVKIPFLPSGWAACTTHPGRTMFVFPAQMNEYVLSVGGEDVRVTVPFDWARSGDFGFESVLWKTFFGGSRRAMYLALEAAIKADGGTSTVYWLSTGKQVRKGDPIISFDILTGDMLFVDRMTYNFFPPKVGQGFVFHTRKIPGIGQDQYYVKRLVGVPGDVLEVRRPAHVGANGAQTFGFGGREGLLYRNDAPITGSDAFRKNANKEGLYPGYTEGGLLSFGRTVEVPPNSFFAMGDNSPNSADGRSWGFVPDKEVVGRPLFIYYPITARWGPAR
ncbi:MAG TPA: signal peptidase I [Lacunisphaera sp.]|nr:signal peptidase I [Lacunisphaera sp.]